jgi:hypothetical protein
MPVREESDIIFLTSLVLVATYLFEKSSVVLASFANEKVLDLQLNGDEEAKARKSSS